MYGVKLLDAVYNGIIVYGMDLGSPFQCAVRAATRGRVLILEGIEKAERNVLPVLNNLLENREMQLDDGRFLMAAERYDKLLKVWLPIIGVHVCVGRDVLHVFISVRFRYTKVSSNLNLMQFLFSKFKSTILNYSILLV